MMKKKVCGNCGGEIEFDRLAVLDTVLFSKCAAHVPGNILQQTTNQTTEQKESKTMNLDQIERLLSTENVDAKMEALKRHTLAEMWEDYRKNTMPTVDDKEAEAILKPIFMAGTFLVLSKLFTFMYEVKDTGGDADKVAEHFQKLMDEANDWAMSRITNAVLKGAIKESLLEEFKKASKRN